MITDTVVMAGSELGIGRFEVYMDDRDFSIYHRVDGYIVNERWCSVHTSNPNLERVCEILRELGFTIATQG